MLTQRRIELRSLAGCVVLWEISGLLAGAVASCTTEEWLTGIFE